MSGIKRLRKFFLYFFASLIAVVALGMWLLPMIFKKQIEERLKAKITEMTGGNYQVNMEDFDINLFTNTISAKEFEMKMDTSVFNQTGNALGVDLSVQNISFSGVNFWKLLFTQTFQLNKIRITNGYARFSWNPDRQKQKNLIDKKGGIEHIILKKILLENVNIQFYNEKKQTTIYSGNANLKFSFLRIDKQGFPTMQSLNARFNASKFYFGDQYFLLDTTYFEYDHAALNIKIVDLNFSDETQHMLKIFPGSQVKYAFKAKELSLIFKDLSQVELLAKNEVKTLLVHQIKVEQPLVTFYRDTLKPNDSIKVYKKIFPLYVGKMKINDGKFIIIDKMTNKTRLISDGIDLDIRMLEPSPPDYIIPFRASVFEIQSDSILYYHKNEMQVTRLLNLSLSTEDSLLKCQRLVIGITKTEEEFFRIKEYQCDLPYVNVESITLNGIDGDLILEKKYLSARKLQADKFYLLTIRNKNYPYRPGKITPMPQDQILGIESPFNLEEVSITGGKIEYFEIPANGNARGNLWIDKIKIMAENITNDTSLLAVNDTMEVTLEGYLYSQGLIQVFANMPLTDPMRTHYVYGKIGPLDPSNLNRITMNCAQMKIQKGMIHSGEFEFLADKNESNGKLNLIFNKLKMKILTRQGDRLKGDNIKSLIANLFITRNNPERGREPIIGAIHWKRDQSRWITNYWWKSLFSGINNIVMSRSAQLQALERNFRQLKKRRPVFNNINNGK
jgi:hypothetical protein